MKTAIHPTYKQATVVCACGNKFTTGSTLEDIQVEICSKCHPFWSGEEKVLDTQGRVDRFKKRATKAAEKATKK